MNIELVREVKRALNEVEFRFYLRRYLIRNIGSGRVQCLACFTPPDLVEIAVQAQENAGAGIYATICEEILHFLGWDDPQARQASEVLAKRRDVRRSIRKKLKTMGIYM